MIYVVVGLGFGDCGKGFTTDYLCLQHPNSIVVRFNGGHQAGHTVEVPELRHVFSNFGSGTLRGVPTYWSENCTVDPVGIMKELETLREYNPKLHLDMNCPIVTPYDKFYNQIHTRTIHDGTCGVGFGTTLQREEDLYSLKVIDLLFENVLKFKLAAIKKYYSDKYPRPLGKELDYDIDIFFKGVKTILNESNISIDDHIPEYNNYIFEGAQGMLLDKNIGFFPNVTRSNTTFNAAEKFISQHSEIKNQFIVPYFVTRAYQTRHGNGPMTNEDRELKIKKDIIETNITGIYQGEFRRTILDLDLIHYGILKQNISNSNGNLMITCLDHLNEYSYTMDGLLTTHVDKNAFISSIKYCFPLTLANVFVSESPFAKNVWKFEN